MTDEQALWKQRLAKRLAGVPWAAIIKAEGIPRGTFNARLKYARLAGWIPSEEDLPPAFRSDGRRVGLQTDGPYQSHPPVQTLEHSIRTGAEHSVDTDAVQTLGTGAVQRLDHLEEEVHSLAHMVRSLVDRLNHAPVQSTGQITTLPPYPKAKADRWNIYLNSIIREEITAWATAREISPSQLVQELLWKALNDRSASTP